MMNWEKGGIAPVYLCEGHANELGTSSNNLEAQTVRSNPKEHGIEVQAPIPAKASASETSGNVTREDFEAFGTALEQGKVSAIEKEMRVRSEELERVCVSRYGERCSGEATVHCPRCGRWFCDAHAEEENWHNCALPI